MNNRPFYFVDKDYKSTGKPAILASPYYIVYESPDERANKVSPIESLQKQLNQYGIKTKVETWKKGYTPNDADMPFKAQEHSKYTA